MVRVQWHTVAPSHSMSPSLSLSPSLCASMPAFTDSRWKWHHKNKTQQIMCKHSFSIFNSCTLAVAFNSLSSLLMLVIFFPFFPCSIHVVDCCCFPSVLMKGRLSERNKRRIKSMKRFRIILCASTYNTHPHNRLNPYKCCLFIHLNLSVNVCPKRAQHRTVNSSSNRKKESQQQLLYGILLPRNLSCRRRAASAVHDIEDAVAVAATAHSVSHFNLNN